MKRCSSCDEVFLPLDDKDRTICFLCLKNLHQLEWHTKDGFLYKGLDNQWYAIVGRQGSNLITQVPCGRRFILTVDDSYNLAKSFGRSINDFY